MHPSSHRLANLVDTADPTPRDVLAALTWQERIQGSVNAAKNWRMTAAGLMLGNVLLAGSLLAVVTTRQVKVFTAFVDPHGVVYRIEREGEGQIGAEAEERVTRAAIGDWVRNSRNVFADWEATRIGILKAYACTSGKAYEALKAYHAQRKPETMVSEGTTRTVTKLERVSLLSANTWQIFWEEEERNRSGQPVKSRWNATVTIARKAPATEDDVQKNPLGIYIDAANIGRDVQ